MNKIACIDVDHIFYLSLTGEKILDENGEPIKVDGKFTYRERTFEESCKVADDYITNILNVTESDGYIGFFGGSSKYRKNIYPEYKANRKDLEPLKNLTEMKSYLADKWNFEWLGNSEQQKELFNCVYETDDYVASFVKQTPDSFIISPDKDLLGLEGNHYNPKKNEWVTIDEITAYYNFWKSMVCGDTTDNIKGLPGRGEAYFKKLEDSWIGVNSLPDTYIEGKEKYSVKIDISQKILYEYIYMFGEYGGIQEFYKNYMCLKIKNDLNVSGFEPVKWENTTIEEQNYDIT
jgi:5'-3' exonuclease